ncbi:interleukin-34 [Brachyhypopomus gauderio]|uniref:interleukin-34 n=1 Tax=Brachyhypopomus gauderio TaxID=698409 RepID=UPI0040414D93
MVWAKARLIWGLLGLLWILPVWVSSVSDQLCGPLGTLREQLNSTFRRRYLKHNFPINYTIQVQYEDVFRLHNISRLMEEEKDPEVTKDLQWLWLSVTQTGIKRILRVLPERHPTRRRYLTGLQDLFRKFEHSYVQLNPQKEVFPERIQDIWDRLNTPDNQGWRSVKPKFLLDNSYRTLHCLFKDCFQTKENDYCNILHWRRGKTTTPQPT